MPFDPIIVPNRLLDAAAKRMLVPLVGEANRNQSPRPEKQRDRTHSRTESHPKRLPGGVGFLLRRHRQWRNRVQPVALHQGAGTLRSVRGGTHRHPDVDHARHDGDSRSFDRPGVARP